MEIILLEKIEKLGNVGDIVSVKDGFARNYLIPQEKALRATNDNKKYFEEQKVNIEKENAQKKAEAEKGAKVIDGAFPVVIRQAGEDGRLFGSVSSKDIALALSDDKTTIDRKTVFASESVKYVGVYPVNIKLHPEVVVTVNLIVARSEDEAKQLKEEFLNPKDVKNEQAEAELAAIAAAEAAVKKAEDASKKEASEGEEESK